MYINKNTFAIKSKVDNYTIFKRLEVFIKIIENGNLSLAAKKLNLTPSSVSRTLKKLEEQTGVILIKRTTRNIIITDAGKYLYQQAIDILTSLNEALLKTSSFYSHPHGQLKITCSIAFGTTQLIQLFSKYKNEHPEVNLSIDLNDKLINLNEEIFDIALRITPNPPNNFAIRKLCKIHWVYCASTEYLSKKGIPKSIKDLETHDCLINPNITHAWSYSKKEKNIFSLKLNNTIIANSTLALIQAALNNQGIVYLPTYMLGEHIQSNKLIPLFYSDSDLHNNNLSYHLYALYHPSKYNDPKIRSFIDFLIDIFKNETPWDKWMNKN